ncbi:metal ABC transporter solute-binding protein, Zn/Mn family [Paracraurococcus ruber]|uniref:Metal ABC transporter substrate-binding protein n=1 Tax=Paracraurococcus ruber TaxID=77675 RepID=A0ABS1CS84_9PROT|nr:zinc ABC transporter substrate-binding protein [Paracraurococcus ruber]MBK1657326.1 metal ABC transporter substrate-binding protein [Paracraurococcus ruber]TDG33996.1 metal ABC transporter substrate-binding protein [Paracraurococcus ruber]
MPCHSRRTLLPLLLAGLPAPALHAQARPVVVASFSILGDLVRQVAGDAVALRVLAGPETDAHVFQPRPSEAEAIRGAALVVRNGLGFEPWLDRLLRSTGFAGPVTTATDGIQPLRAAPMPGHSHGADAPDPHAWQDVRLAQSYARRIAAGLAGAAPQAGAAVRAGAEACLDRLGALDAWVRGQFASVPEGRRVLVTSHDAFGYFAAAYGVRVLAPQGMGGQAQPSAQQVAALIRRIREDRITAVFLEGPGSQAVMERLARDAGVVPRGRLYADTLSLPDGPAPGYEAMVRHNVGLMVPAMLG